MLKGKTMLEIGKLKLKSPLVLAPIAGYTDSPFRKLSSEFGAGFTMTELISSEGIVRGCEKTFSMLKFSEAERPLGIQIFGNNPYTLARAAEAVTGLNPDFIDVNIGCPARKVTGSGNGAALLKDPDLIYRIIKSVVAATPLNVSAKIRIGWDEDSLNYLDVLKALEEAGVSFIIVHGRTKSQQYGGSADWDIIKEIREKSSVPVIGNGDINSYLAAFERLEFSKCAAVMIGRGAIGNPWIFSGYTPSVDELVSVIVRHLDLMIEEYGTYGINLMRKHLVRYIHGTKNAAKIRSSLVSAVTREEIVDILKNIEANV